MKGIIILLSCFLIVNCNHQPSEENLSMGKYGSAEDHEILANDISIDPPRTEESPPPPEFTLDKGSKIIKIGILNFEVTKLEETKSRIDSLMKSSNGYYENEFYNSYGNRITYSLKIRVPNSKFDSLLMKLEHGIGELKSKNISAQDVTEEYVDLNIRLENNLAYLKQYQTILLQAKSIKDILEVQDKIRILEEEIDSKKGRIKYLDDQVNFSTLNLEISELITSEITNNPSFVRRTVNAFNNGVQGFLSFLVILVNIWPFLLLLVFVILARKPIWSKFRKRNTPTNKPKP